MVVTKPGPRALDSFWHLSYVHFNVDCFPSPLQMYRIINCKGMKETKIADSV